MDRKNRECAFFRPMDRKNRECPFFRRSILGPVCEFQPSDLDKILRVACDQKGVVCERDASDQHVRAFHFQLLLPQQRLEVPSRCFIDVNQKEVVEGGLSCLKPLGGDQQLALVSRLEQAVRSAPDHLHPGHSGDSELLALPSGFVVPANFLVPVGEEGEDIGVEDNHPPAPLDFAARIEERLASTSSRSPSSLKTPTCRRTASLEPRSGFSGPIRWSSRFSMASS